MKKCLLTGVVLCSVLILPGLVLTAPAAAGVRIDIGVAFPPIFIPAPPALIMIPGTPVYYPPAVGVDLFFYNGYWYRPHLGRWYIAGHFNGPWSHLTIGSVPGVLVSLPLTHRRVHPGPPHGMFWERWQTRERDWFWDRDERGRFDGNRGKGKHRGHGRGRDWDD